MSVATTRFAVDEPRSRQALLTLLSGLVVAFVAFGVGSWFSGVASWVGFYLGARDQTLIGVAQGAACIGFAGAVAIALIWYRNRCRRGAAEIPLRMALGACLVLPIGNISWAIFVDAIAWHYGQDIVRPAFDMAIMYLILGGIVPLSIGVPWMVTRLRRGAQEC